MQARKFLLILVLLVSGTFVNSRAQCTFDPTITGDTLLCPNGTGILTTQVYDTYQWYKRPMFSGSWTMIPGATTQTINIDAANDAAYYFRVDVTLNGCTESSPEVLVDSWVFLLPFTIIEGDYTIGPNGEIIVCQGDTALLISGSPYDTNLQWFDNGNPIPGANNDTLIVTAAGSYTFSGAPALCPNFIQNQFIPVDVVIITCPTGLEEAPGYELGLYPNPASDIVTVNYPGCDKIYVYDALGKLVLTTTTDPKSHNHEVNVSKLESGIYTVTVTSGKQTKSGLLFRK